MSPVEVIIAIGSLPFRNDRALLIGSLASPADDHHRYYSLLSPGSGASEIPSVDDVEHLSMEDSLAFLRGIDAVYASHLRRSRDCVCNMPPVVVFPVVVYASMLRRDFQYARLNWDTFAKLPRNCAERLARGNYPDLRLITFEQFVQGILKNEYTPKASFDTEQASLVSRKMLDAYDIQRHR